MRRLRTDLHPRTRRTLSQAGFDLREWNDRQLKSVEYTATAVASGERVFVSSEMAPLVDTLVQESSSRIQHR